MATYKLRRDRMLLLIGLIILFILIRKVKKSPTFPFFDQLPISGYLNSNPEFKAFLLLCVSIVGILSVLRILFPPKTINKKAKSEV